MKNQAEHLFAKLDQAILEAIWVPNDLLPERYQDNREGGSDLERVERIYNNEVAPLLDIDPREKSVVFRNGKIHSGSQERIDILNRYRDAVEADYANFPDSTGEEDFYVENEYRLYRNQQAFASAIGLEIEDEE